MNFETSWTCFPQLTGMKFRFDTMNLKIKFGSFASIAILVLIGIGVWMQITSPKPGQVYVFVNPANFQHHPWRERPEPYVQILTVLEVSNSFARVNTATVFSGGRHDYTEGVESFKALKKMERIR